MVGTQVYFAPGGGLADGAPDAADVLLARAEAFQRARLYDPFYTFQLAFEAMGGDLEADPVSWDPRVLRVLGGLSIEAALSASHIRALVSTLWYLFLGVESRGMRESEVAYVASLLGIRVDEVPEMMKYGSQLDYDDGSDDHHDHNDHGKGGKKGRSVVVMSPAMSVFRQALIDAYHPYSHLSSVSTLSNPPISE